MPNGELTYKRGEIRWVNLNPTIGAETKKNRPCLIIQNDIMNQYGLLTIIIPFRSGQKKAPYTININANEENGLSNDSFLDLGQIRAVDYQRILGLIGTLDNQYWMQIKSSLDIVLGFTDL